MTDNPPKLVVFAGPNGSGKSTITSQFQQSPEFPSKYINADEIALTLDEDNPTRKAYQAAILAEEQRQDSISQRESFAFETVMLHPSKLKLLEQAKDAGYQVELVFVATSNPDLNVNRVKQRAAEGGHDVPENKVRSRYQRSIELLPAAAEIASRTFVYDNTKAPRQKAEIENGTVTFQAQDSPTWVQDTESRAADRQSIATNSELPVSTANIDTGKYVGEISQITDSYIAQETGDNLTIHDKSIAKGDFEVGQDVRIAYKDGNVAASIQPTSENQQWAEGIYDTASYIFQAKENEGQTEMPSRGIKVASGDQYSVELNNNSKTLTVLSNGDNRTVASFDLEEQSVIASNPSDADKQQWAGIISQTQDNIHQVQIPNNKPEIND
ncbi:MAG: zeta toxin family protein [Cyanobacteria bacterium P01_A01_bin.84]